MKGVLMTEDTVKNGKLGKEFKNNSLIYKIEKYI